MTTYRKVILSFTVEFDPKRPGNPDDAATGSIEQFWREDMTAGQVLKAVLQGLESNTEEEPWPKMERE